MTDTMTCAALAPLLENETHNELAERIRAGSDAVQALGDGQGRRRKGAAHLTLRRCSQSQRQGHLRGDRSR